MDGEGSGRKRGEKLKTVKYLPDATRMLPSSPEAEQGVICSMMLDPEQTGGICSDMGMTSEWFHIPSHGTIFSALNESYQAHAPIDVIQLTQKLRDRETLDSCGGPAFVVGLYTYLPTAANASYYAEIVKEKFTLREMIRVGTHFSASCYDAQDEVWDSLQNFEREVLSIRSDKGAKKTKTAREAVMEAIEVIQNVYENKGTITGLTTGFSEFDAISDGLKPAEMIVIAGRPSQGKTAFAMNIAEHIAVDLKLPVAVFSLEMSTSQLMQRALCSRARVNLKRVREGNTGERDFPLLTRAASQIADSPLYFDDTAAITIQELCSRARRMKKDYGIVALFVDYLQLMKSASKKSMENRQLEVSEVSSGLKALAKELNIPIVALCQLGRDFEKRGATARPRLTDLRESGSIEQDADLVAMIVRAETYAETDEEKRELEGQADLIIAKQRNGPVGDVALTFLKEYTRFETRARDQDEYAQAHQQEEMPLTI